jgi:hypothetical protein
MIGLGSQMLQLPLLPFRMLGLGLQALAQTLERGRQVAGQGEAGRLPSVAPDPGSLVSSEGRIRPTGTAVDRSKDAITGGAFGQGAVASSSFGQETFAGGAASCGAAARCLETQAKEDKDMTCCCDQNLSGCDLKIVQYTIVSVDPYIDRDWRRIVLPDHPILIVATQDDMTDADFTAFAIARAQRLYPRVRRYRAQYLRVCFKVLCRFTMPCVDYEREQADALRGINETLRRDKGLPPYGGLTRWEEEEEGRVRAEEAEEEEIAQAQEEGEEEKEESTPPARRRRRR